MLNLASIHSIMGSKALANASALTAFIVSIASVAILSKNGPLPCPARPQGRDVRNEEERTATTTNSDQNSNDKRQYAGLGLAARLAEAVQSARKG